MLAPITSWAKVIKNSYLNPTNFWHGDLDEVPLNLPIDTQMYLFKARYSDMDGGQKFYHYHYIERVFFLLRELFSDISNAAYKNKLRARYSDTGGFKFYHYPYIEK
ncbi:hypothetical protein J3Q64DRAFT_1702089 [Phycomyces blakesleeanus]|uniref:Uncharacterized protein n=2 Tax=Phycomyces blakesleeanus TaxID=4837 RepID=A0A167RCI5_PHYB8|nr:hypothetical protein PHYBLDRAFT_161959 [Phycomyces blakesleeanus NRRL 1555(-)]OAD81347.1 hypothetical protein PHYBLDRAFT_161959 [Phycomyces blakesleeanus NRRL 1555(-)]|eukprot:XP_018299387.1 hypothetical protein PHYBLDRAFT_161959 [Phycomyces blakesleeanus NRRL 1555(-)]